MVLAPVPPRMRMRALALILSTHVRPLLLPSLMYVTLINFKQNFLINRDNSVLEQIDFASVRALAVCL